MLSILILSDAIVWCGWVNGLDVGRRRPPWFHAFCDVRRLLVIVLAGEGTIEEGTRNSTFLRTKSHVATQGESHSI